MNCPNCTSRQSTKENMFVGNNRVHVTRLCYWCDTEWTEEYNNPIVKDIITHGGEDG